MSIYPGMSAEHMTIDKAVTEAAKRREVQRRRRAAITVAGYALRHSDSRPDAVQLARQLIDQLGLNGQPTGPSRHARGR